jgi:hypothetical protein
MQRLTSGGSLLVAVQISWGVNATDPVEIIGVIPNGNAFVLPTKSNVNGRGWDVNIAAGTTYLLTMLDSGSIGNGGSSDFLYTRQSNNTECIDAAASLRRRPSPSRPAATAEAVAASGPAASLVPSLAASSASP